MGALARTECLWTSARTWRRAEPGSIPQSRSRRRRLLPPAAFPDEEQSGNGGGQGALPVQLTGVSHCPQWGSGLAHTMRPVPGAAALVQHSIPSAGGSRSTSERCLFGRGWVGDDAGWTMIGVRTWSRTCEHTSTPVVGATQIEATAA